ncbi:hypothetical protein F5Y14DRAFT_190784 [Nemania sp. NC0429]|nr:hypothetical protein F5Y14DRAFT_190784 [Nemania sp. NC0429]
MTTTPPLSDTSSVMTAAPAFDAQGSDPFRSSGSSDHRRFSHFNAQLFALGPDVSPAQAKRALEAHLAETDRRMEEAGRLGTALVQQRNELTDRLREVEKLQAEGELSDDLRQKLVDIEKDYNEVARESARAFLPKSRVPSNEAVAGSAFVPDGKGGKRSVSPSKFEAQATGSPTKLSVPNRKIRNQPSHRIHDIEFAAEISTSLIAQVRNLQGLLSEREDDLKDTRAENLKLEYELEGFQQRLKTLDDSEHRYKDENWNLETQLHELMAKEREAADREKKLTQALNVLQAEKNAGQRELDEIKLTHSKLVEEHAAVVKHHDIELGTVKRTMAMSESERTVMQKTIDDLTGRNTELAKAMSMSIRGRKLDRESIMGMSEDDFQTANDNSTPEQSPPPSPVKGTPRHSILESETLKSSLAHAQRTIQSLRTNVHKEKTEKLETRRLLQEARDEIEKLRDPVVPTRRARKSESREFKKPPRLLGALRSARSEIFDDPNWEDQPPAAPLPQSSPLVRETTAIFDPIPELTDHFETANETSDAAFETAEEMVTETDDFHTGAEEFSSDDTETETDTPTKRRTLGHPPNLFETQRSGSIDSSASTEDEDFPYDYTRTPTSLPPPHARYPLRVSRGAYRRSRQTSEEPSFQSSPMSFVNSSTTGTPQQPVKSLAAELGDFDASDNESNLSATPSRRSIRGRAMTPPPALPPLPRAIMVDSGMMTEPLRELSASLNGIIGTDRPISANTSPSRFSLGSNYGETGTNEFGEKLPAFPTPPTSSHKHDLAAAPELALSTMHSHNLEPHPEPDTHGAEITALHSAHTEQLERLVAETASTHAAAIETMRSQHAEELAAIKHAHARDIEVLRSENVDATDRAVSAIRTTHTREIELLQSRHAEEMSQVVADAQASHDKDIESLKILHAQLLLQKQTESETTRAADLASLQAAHDDELVRRESESTSVHAAGLERLKTDHAQELIRRESEWKGAHDDEVRTLRAAHAEEVSQKEAKLEAAASAELESLKAVHAEQLSQFKTNNEATHAAELTALVEAHTSKIHAIQKELSETHVKELEDLKASHVNQMNQARQSLETTFSQQLQSLEASHSQQIEEIKDSLHATHGDEMESLRIAHAQELANVRNENATAHAAAIAALTDVHNKQLADTKAGLQVEHLRELEALRVAHAQQAADLANEKDTAHSAAIATLVESHKKQIGDIQDSLATAHTQELEHLKASHLRQLGELAQEKDADHATAASAMTETHAKQLQTQKAEGEAALSREIVALKAAHADEIENLNSQHAAAHARELESFKAAIAKQVESSKTEGDAAHSHQIEALNIAHAEIVDAHKRDAEIAQSQALEALKLSHERHIDTLTSEYAAARTKESELVTTKHLDELKDLRAAHAASKAEELENLTNKHLDEVKGLKNEHEVSVLRLSDELNSAKLTELEALRQELQAIHANGLRALRQESDDAHSKEIDSLSAKHTRDLEVLRGEHDATISQRLQALRDDHSQILAKLREEDEKAKSDAIANLSASHTQLIDTLKSDHEAELTRRMQELAESHARDLENLRQENESSLSGELAALKTTHQDGLDSVKNKFDLIRQKELAEAEAAHAAALASLRAQHQTELERNANNLTVEHLKMLETVKTEKDVSHSEALAALGVEHSQRVDQLKREHDASLTQELHALNADHSRILESQVQESDVARAQALKALEAQHKQNLDLQIQESATTLARELELLSARHAEILEAHTQENTIEKESLLASHAAALETLRSSLTIPSPMLGYSSISSIETEPIELPETKTPKREAFIIPQDKGLGSGTSHQSSQTMLTGEVLDQLMKPQAKQSQAVDTVAANGSKHGGIPPGEAAAPSPATIRIRRPSTESISSVTRIRIRAPESGTVVAPEALPLPRPGSSASSRSSVQRPPLPPNHREVIEAARSGSANGGKGTMPPPALPASAYRPSSSGPQTPSNNRPVSPSSVIKMTPSIRTGSRITGHADVHSATKMPIRSRQSSISSFASEIDSRFNINRGLSTEPTGFGYGADPRMIQAVTQTMIGEFLWKYTRKTGRGGMSEKRHRRYFWVHPYTRTLYWSESDPTDVAHSERKTKSVPIEAVHVVPDDNPYPPGIHIKSLVVVAPGRTVKFTCPSGQRHETWFNALSYLLLRSGDENKQDAEEVSDNITQEDVAEFNPSLRRRSETTQRTRAAPSLSSYNSRTTRNESPALDMTMNTPTLTPTHEREAPRNGSLGKKLSGYWSRSIGRANMGSFRNRPFQPYDPAIYEATEVPDSAEDLRQIIEQQDRESDKLENVRACCDGKHDVGMIPHRTTRRGRLPSFQAHTHSHSHAGPSSGSHSAMGSIRSRI